MLVPANASPADRRRYDAWAADETPGEPPPAVALHAHPLVVGRPCEHAPLPPPTEWRDEGREDGPVAVENTDVQDVRVLRGVMAQEDARRLVDLVRDDPSFVDDSDIARTDGLPRRQVTLLRQACVCASCHRAHGAFAAFHIVADSERHADIALDLVLPVAHRVLEAVAPGSGLSLWSAFVRRYLPNERTGVPPHVDACSLTASVTLSDPATCQGGHLVFAASPARPAPVPCLGDAVVHPGSVPHAVTAVTAGARWRLLLFYGSDDGEAH